MSESTLESIDDEKPMVSETNVTYVVPEQSNVTFDYIKEQLNGNSKFRNAFFEAVQRALLAKEKLYKGLQLKLSERIVKAQISVLRELCQYGERKATLNYIKEDGTLGTFEIDYNPNLTQFTEQVKSGNYEGQAAINSVMKTITGKTNPQNFTPDDMRIFNHLYQCSGFFHDWIGAREAADAEDIEEEKKQSAKLRKRVKSEEEQDIETQIANMVMPRQLFLAEILYGIENFKKRSPNYKIRGLEDGARDFAESILNDYDLTNDADEKKIAKLSTYLRNGKWLPSEARILENALMEHGDKTTDKKIIDEKEKAYVQALVGLYNDKIVPIYRYAINDFWVNDNFWSILHQRGIISDKDWRRISEIQQNPAYADLTSTKHLRININNLKKELKTLKQNIEEDERTKERARRPPADNLVDRLKSNKSQLQSVQREITALEQEISQNEAIEQDRDRKAARVELDSLRRKAEDEFFKRLEDIAETEDLSFDERKTRVENYIATELRQIEPGQWKLQQQEREQRQNVTEFTEIAKTYGTGLTQDVHKRVTGKTDPMAQLRVDGGTWKGDSVYDTIRKNNRDFFSALAENNRIVVVRDEITRKLRTFAENQHKILDAFRKALTDFDTEVLGRENIKGSIAKLCIAFIHNPEMFTKQYLTFSLTGGAGTGKSTIAQVLGPILASLGILVSDSRNTYSRGTLVAGVLGETAIKVDNIMKANLENVMFIDEAYAVAQGASGRRFDDYGLEAVNQMTAVLDKTRGQIAFIVAGYKCEMDAYFFAANVGMRRRVKYHWELEAYSPIELMRILSYMLNKANLPLHEIASKEAIQFLYAFMTETLEPSDMDYNSPYWKRIDGSDDAVGTQEIQETALTQSEEDAGATILPEADAMTIDPGQYLFRRLFQNEAGDMEVFADKLKQFYRSAGEKIDVKQMLRMLVDMLYPRDGFVDVRAKIEWDEDYEQCKKVKFMKIFRDELDAMLFIVDRLDWINVSDDALDVACLLTPCGKSESKKAKDARLAKQKEMHERQVRARERLNIAQREQQALKDAEQAKQAQLIKEAEIEAEKYVKTAEGQENTKKIYIKDFLRQKGLLESEEEEDTTLLEIISKEAFSDNDQEIPTFQKLWEQAEEKVKQRHMNPLEAQAMEDMLKASGGARRRRWLPPIY